MRRTRLSAAVLLGVASVLTPLAAMAGPASAATSGPGPNTPEQVPYGIDVSSLPGAQAFGNTPPNTPETVSFILKERNKDFLQAEVTAGVRNDLTVSQFASQYGQSAANISALTSYLAGFGIKTTVYADDLDVSATGTAGEFDSALSVTQKQYSVPGFGSIPAQSGVHGNTGAPMLPYRLSSFVLAILGLTNYSAYFDHVVKPAKALAKAQVQAGGNVNTSCLSEFGLPNGCHVPADFAQQTNVDGLYSQGATGAGRTLAIVTLAAVDPNAPQFFWSNIAKVNRTGSFVVDNIDGGPGAPSASAGSDETDLDLEQSGAIAPGANVIDYQAPNTDPGFADAFFTAASEDTADTVSTSWGESETALAAFIHSGQETAAYQAAFDEVFLELAVQGQSAFDASGDAGAYDDSNELGTTNLSIDTNSDSPYITATGGTTLPWTATFTGPAGSAVVSVPAQRIWGWDYLWQPVATVTGTPLATVAEGLVVGGGGGFSAIEGIPSYQLLVSGPRNFHAVPYLTPTNFQTIAPGLVEPTAWNFNATPATILGAGNGGRATPDVSANADPETGFLVWAPSDGGLTELGGTSFTAPQFNGATAVMDSFLGHRVGFWNPGAYAAVAHGGSPFTQLNTAGTTNDNIFYTGNPGEAYNEGIGLGIPDLTRLASDLG